VALLVLAGPGVQAGAGHAPRAVAPIAPIAVVRPFTPPVTAYGPGHRGVDLAAPAGTPVHAALGGTVVFAGDLAGRGVVSVAVTGGRHVTYEPLEAVVRAGEAVQAGQLLGYLTAGHPGCPVAACLHWGLFFTTGDDRVYLDPLTLLGQGVVRLLPWQGEPVA